ncbi:MAG: TetR/AcrR family transcriptional regulator [Acidimicrobiales bacterium]
MIDGSAASGRERILDSSARLFAERGFAETSLRVIAADIDMKAGSLYYHFASKDDLLVSVLERGIELMTDRFELVELEWSAVSSASDEAAHRSRLLAHVVGHLEVLHGHYPYTSLHITTFRTAPEAVRVAVVPFRDAYEAKWTALLAELLPERPADEISILRLVLFGAMNSSIEWFDAGRGNLDHFANVVTDQFWFGVTRQERQVQ